MAFASSFLSELEWRGFIHQATDLAGLDAHLAGAEPATARRAYIGFDPTSDSLTIGNLIPIMILAHFQRAGHTPVVVAGGGTGLIGDPSGKSAERMLMTPDRVAANVASQMRIYGRVLKFDGAANPAVLVNNLDWLGKLTYLEALRDIGKHFSVNMMIQKDSVKARLESRDQGISYTEFSYMILQAYDFAHLHRHMGVTLQMGASDQWGNIVAGVDLIRRYGAELWSRSEIDFGEAREMKKLVEKREATQEYLEQAKLLEARSDHLRREFEAFPHEGSSWLSFGLTTPLLTKADGAKYGKTESGAVWLTAERTSPYALYQFALNTADSDVEMLLKKLTFLTQPEVAGLMAEQAANPGARAPQRALARHLTELVHGAGERETAERAAAALFSGEIAALDERTLEEALGAAPASTHERGLLSGEGMALMDLLAVTLCKSKSEARQALTEGSVSVNGKKATPTDRITAESLLFGRLVALRRGKKNWHLTRWS